MKKITPDHPATRGLSSSLFLALLLAGTWTGPVQAEPLALIATDLNAPQGVALGDVDGDGFLDLVVATQDAPNRLYLGQGAGRFGAGTDIDTDELNTAAVALGDVDGDGDLDLVTGNRAGLNRLYLNIGPCAEDDEACQRQTVFGAGSDLSPDSRDTTAIALALIDADEALDLVVVNVGEPNQVYFNQGDGVFLRSASVDVSADIATGRALALGDVDGDGDVDLAIANFDQPNRLYLNDGQGRFSGLDIGADNQPSNDLVLRDGDGDGDLDLWVANDGAANRLYLNNGSGVFDGGVDIGSDSSDTQALVAGDLDGDGDTDLIAGNVAAPDRLYLNQGGLQGGVEGVFDAGHNTLIDNGDVNTLLLHDFAGNGSPDLLATTRNGVVSLYRNSSLGLFGNGFGGVTGRAIGGERDGSLSAAVADLDGDGDLDYVVGNENALNRVYINQGDGSFVLGSSFGSATEATQALLLRDLDGDGDADVVSGNWAAPNRVYLNQGDGRFGAALDVSADANQTTALAVADLDQDGNLDLVVGNSGQRNRLHLGQGDGTFAAGTDISEDENFTEAVVLGDVDGDGRVDVLAINKAQRERNRLYINVADAQTGAIVFTDRQGQAEGENLPEADDESYAALLVDLDGDGDLDYIDGSSGLSRYYLNDGNGLYGDGLGGGVGFELNPDRPHSVFALDAGDVDGDGDLDLVVATGHVNRLYLNQGGLQGGIQGRFDYGSDLNADALGTYAIALADMDGDSRLDVVTANWEQSNRYYPNLTALLTLRVVPEVSSLVVTESVDPVQLGIGCLGAGSGDASVDYAFELANEANSAAEDDVSLVSGTLTWEGGGCEAKQITLSVTFDDQLEGDEVVYLVLSNPQGFEDNNELPSQRRYPVTIKDGFSTAVVAEETPTTTTAATTAGGGGGALFWLLLVAASACLLHHTRWAR